MAVTFGEACCAAAVSLRLGRSDAGIILWRKILARELRAIAEGRKPKRWKTLLADVVPTLGF